MKKKVLQFPTPGPLSTGYSWVDDFVTSQRVGKGWKIAPNGSYYSPKHWRWDDSTGKLIRL